MKKNKFFGLEISILSFIILSLELSLIRFIPAEVRAISYFTNLLLFSSFFGLGIGCILSQKRDLSFLFPIGLISTALFIYFSRGIVIYDTGGQVHYWLQGLDQRHRPFLEIPLAFAALITFTLTSISFVALGQALALAMDRLPRLQAYSWDIAGSLLGTVAFAVISFFGMPPWVFIICLSLLWMAYFSKDLPGRLNCIFAAAFFLIFTQSPHSWKWSPYYFIQYNVNQNNLTVWVNSSFHQEAIQFETTDKAYRASADMMMQKFSVPYETYRKHHEGKNPFKVLILGGGTGNDANVALKNGAQKVTVVEIDPVILKLGKQFNQLKPYQNNKVEIVNDDGRHFLWNTKERFDLVIFGTLDSQTLLSSHANLRLENYIYTVECFKDVRKILTEGGMFAAYYSVFKPWFLGRIYATTGEAFKGAQQIVTFKDNYLFNTIIMGSKNLASFVSNPNTDDVFKDEISSTDDWPYIYLQYPTIAPLYIYVMSVIFLAIFGVFQMLKKIERSNSNRLNFFFLGLGFTMLESAAVVRLALLFGTTWVVTAVVFSGALVMIFFSNLFIFKIKKWNLSYSWFALFLTVLINYYFPIDILFGFSFVSRFVITLLLIGSPIFFAGACFSKLFSKEECTGYALGINLIGAMAGGLLEYFSMLIGMRAIWLLILVVYLMAFYCNLKSEQISALKTSG